MDEQPSGSGQAVPRPWLSNPFGPFTKEDLDVAEQIITEHPLGNLSAGTCCALVHGNRAIPWPCQTLRWSDLVRLAGRRGRIPGVPAA